MKKLKIGVAGGLGHIGLMQAACLAEYGYQTVAYDKDLSKIDKIKERKMPFREKGLEGLVEKALASGRLQFSNQIKHLEQAGIVYICVGTPSLPAGQSDITQVEAAVEEVVRKRNSQVVIAIKSTVPVGTGRRITSYLRKQGLINSTIVSNPEFLSEGSGIRDFWEPTRIVVGSDTVEAAESVSSVYAPPGVPVIITSWENAELIKYASNAFLATKISFINEIARLSEKAGGDIRFISRGIGLDPRIGSHFLEAGVGFSGPCLEKDLKSLISQFKENNCKSQLLQAVLEVNQRQRDGIVQKLQHRLGPLAGKQIGVWGMAFKPQTDDVRQSHSLPIIKHLLSLGALVTVHDCWLHEPEDAGLSKDELPGVTWVSSPYEASRGKEAILILTGWPDYSNIDLQRLKESMTRPVIIDGRNLFDPKEMKQLGFDYQGVGR